MTHSALTAVVLLPRVDTPYREVLGRKVCGVPVIARVLATAASVRAMRFLVIDPSEDDPNGFLAGLLSHRVLNQISFKRLAIPNFDPDNPAFWCAVAKFLDDRFIWLPWNAFVNPVEMKELLAKSAFADSGVRFSSIVDGGSQDVIGVLRTDHCTRDGITSALASAAVFNTRTAPGCTVVSSRSIEVIERCLIRKSGKETDGIYSRFNRRLVEPVLPLLCRAQVSPNTVTLVGLLLSLPAAYFFAQGHWLAYIAGALCYVLCVFFDELDGMLARLTFRTSPLGCWLETVADYASYLFLFGGLTLGLYRSFGTFWLWIGVALIAGTIATMSILAHQRTRYTDKSRPHEFRKLLHRELERDSRNVFSRFTRTLEFMIRKPAYCYYVLLFVAFNQPKPLLLLTALGANVAWIMALSSNRLLKTVANESSA